MKFWSILRKQTEKQDFQVHDIIDFQSDSEHEAPMLQAQGYAG